MKNNYIEDFRCALKKEGLKYTSQRYNVLKFLFDNKGHFECDDILFSLKKKGSNISRATIYRTLDILVKYDFARKLILDGTAKYENKINTKHHDHMICIESGDIIEFCSDEIEKIQDNIAKRNGYEVVRHVHHLFENYA